MDVSTLLMKKKPMKKTGDSSLKSYKLRMRRTAKALPKKLVVDTLGTLRTRILAARTSKGARIKTD